MDRLLFEMYATIRCRERGEFRCENCNIGSSTQQTFALFADDLKIFTKNLCEIYLRLFQDDPACLRFVQLDICELMLRSNG